MDLPRTLSTAAYSDNPDFSTQKWLNKKSRDGLASRGLIPDEVQEHFTTMSDMLTKLKQISIKELKNEKWQQMLKAGQAPPSWIKSFSVGQPTGVDMPTESLDTGC